MRALRNGLQTAPISDLATPCVGTVLVVYWNAPTLGLPVAMWYRTNLA